MTRHDVMDVLLFGSDMDPAPLPAKGKRLRAAYWRLWAAWMGWR